MRYILKEMGTEFYLKGTVRGIVNTDEKDKAIVIDTINSALEDISFISRHFGRNYVAEPYVDEKETRAAFDEIIHGNEDELYAFQKGVEYAYSLR